MVSRKSIVPGLQSDSDLSKGLVDPHDQASVEALLVSVDFKLEGHDPSLDGKTHYRGGCPVCGSNSAGDNCRVTLDQFGTVARCFTSGDQCPSSRILHTLGITPIGLTAKPKQLVKCGVLGCNASLDSLVAVYEEAVDQDQADDPNYTPRTRGAHRVDCAVGVMCSYPNCSESDTKHVWSCPTGDTKGRWHVKVWGEDSGHAAIILVEGERAARQVLDQQLPGYLAATWPGGTSGVKHACFDRLADRQVILWPDNDQVGFDAMRKAAKALVGKAKVVLEVDPEYLRDFPDGYDAGDMTQDQILTTLTHTQKVDVSTQTPVYGPPEFMEGELHQPAFARRFLQYAMVYLGIALNPESNYRATIYVINWTGVWRQHETYLLQLYRESIDKYHQAALDANVPTQFPKVWAAFINALRDARRLPYFKQVLDWVAAEANGLRESGELTELAWVDDIAELNADLRYMGALNGVIDLWTGKLLIGDAAKAKLVSRQLPVAYVPDAVSEDVERLTGDHYPADDREWLWEALGHALRGSVDRRIYYCIGEGGEGKSTFARAIYHALGPYASIVNQDAYAVHKDNRSGISPENASFVDGIRLAFSLEKIQSTVSQSRMKSLSGGDPVSWRPPFGQLRTSETTATQVHMVNELPEFDLADAAFMDRLRILRVRKPDTPDLDLPRRLSSPEAKQAIVAKLVRYAVEAVEPPSNTPTIEVELGRAVRDSMPEVEWLEAIVEVVPGLDYRVEAKVLYQRAQQYDSNGSHPDLVRPWGLDQHAFTARVVKHFDLPVTKPIRVKDGIGRTRVGRGWVGVRLRTTAEVESILVDGVEPAGVSADGMSTKLFDDRPQIDKTGVDKQLSL